MKWNQNPCTKSCRRPSIEEKEVRLQMFVKLSVRELCDSKLSGLHPFGLNIMAIIY